MTKKFQYAIDLASIAKDDAISQLYKHAKRFAYSSDSDIYLSPHYDDICFSLGSFVARRKSGGTLLTLFSRSDHLLEKSAWHQCTFQTMDQHGKIEAASAVRSKEDLAFAERAGLNVIFADFDEAPIRDRDPFAQEGSEEDAIRFAPQLLDSIAAVTKRMSRSRSRIFCPIGIGGHIDHLTTLRAVVRHYEDLSSRHQIIFYEDLFYASHLENRIHGISRFRNILGRLKPRRWMLPVNDCAKKLELIHLYRSQFLEVPENLATFNPATLLKLATHEAVWTVA